MKKLLLTFVLGLVFAFPISAFPSGNIFGVDTTVKLNSVNDNVYGGYVAKDLGDTFQVQKLINSESPKSERNSSDKYVIFGVDLKDINQI